MKAPLPNDQVTKLETLHQYETLDTEQDTVPEQRKREQLTAEIAQRIRQSLKLDDILNTTVSEVCQFLQADRVFIYRFKADRSGVVIAESVNSDCLPIVGRKIKDSFFRKNCGWQLYQQGRVQVTEDIYTAGLSECHIRLLTQLHIRANLIVPILQKEELWGLLAVNQCTSPRQWQQSDSNRSGGCTCDA